MNADDVLDAMQAPILERGQPPRIQAVTSSLGRTKRAVLQCFPDRAALDAALTPRAIVRLDAAMADAAVRGDAVARYLRLSLPTAEDRAVALIVLVYLRGRDRLPLEIGAAVERWEALMTVELLARRRPRSFVSRATGSS